MGFERERGRRPEEQPHENPGFDIISVDPATDQSRYIEVKSMSEDWGVFGVGLSYRQYEEARTRRGDYWLYVVERADLTTSRMAAFRIPTEIALGAGSWRARGFLGLPSIEEGAPADLVAYERNPMDDLEILSTPSLIVLDGNVIRSPQRMPSR